MWMEAWKFAVYLAVPIAASAYFNNPERMRKAAEYWEFIQYPANPVTGLREQIIKAQEQSPSREEYRKQMERLHQAATESTTNQQDERQEKVGFWRRVLGSGNRSD